MDTHVVNYIILLQSYRVEISSELLGDDAADISQNFGLILQRDGVGSISTGDGDDGQTHAFLCIQLFKTTYHCNTHKALCTHGTWGLGLQRQKQSPVELTQQIDKIGSTSKCCHRKVDG
jgi:hypothetical protein